ncbi:right-handed parallel beta-helix repeat-containing protein [Bartonella schoenbuchensis]|uniref:Right handed beta helix domain-containing protein n=1 Tax=Bartonella schoenbuchensis m07a TaxID=1094496 RepID=N6VC01_9HYPH|nr:right-handed parallel beta-helix repeat-containing protein [Bartonella schoenbuchensis]ENN91330.1 hypothetical protein m07a_02010 [Bartonella schoenbuchensis m07a]
MRGVVGWDMEGKVYVRVRGGIGGSSGELSGPRTIDMKDEPSKPAVKVHGSKADITIVGKLTITDSKRKSTGPAIQVEKQGKLVLAGEVDIQNVYKGIVADGKGSSVTVTKGVIGVRGDYVIGVKNGGTVTLIDGVKVNGGGIGVKDGGTVTLGGEVKVQGSMGIVFMGDKGTANATVMGVGAKINLASGSTGAVMMGDGALMLNTVTIEGVGVGARVTKGTLEVTKGSIQGTTVGAEVSGSGVLEVNGRATIVGTTMGLRVTGSGKATMMGGSIQGGGSGGSYGVIVDTSGTVELSGGVEVSRFETGVYVKGGTFKMTEGSITGMGNSQGTGIYAVGDDVTLNTVTISKVGVGVEVEKGVLIMNQGSVKGFTGTGVMVGDGVESASLTGTTITGDGKGTGVYMEGGDVKLDNVRIKGVAMGVMMEKGGKSLTISGSSTIEFVGDGVGVGVWGEVKSAELTQTVITGKGSGTGVYAERGTLIIEKGTTIDFKESGWGVYVKGGIKNVSLTGTTITGEESGSTGVYAKGKEGMVMTLEGVDIEGVGTGVRMMEGESLTINGGSIKGVQTGIVMMKGESLTISGDSTISFMGDYGVYGGEFGDKS